MPKQPRMQGGRPPRMPDMQQMLRQVEKAQEDMKRAEESLKDERVEASAGGGVVTVEISGDLQVKSVSIDPQALGSGDVDQEDLEMLSDMVIAAVNEAIKAAQELAGKRMEEAAGPLAGLGDMGGLGGLGGSGGLGGLL
jgi:nucleoid-associated protein EbfC